MVSHILSALVVGLMVVSGFITPPAPKSPLTIHYYDYFKKNKDGTKKEVGRLWKNIMFPGIYTDYEDTAEPLKTVKVTTKQAVKTRNTDKEVNKFQPGRYNVADEKSIPTYSGALVSKKTLPPVKKPADFVAPKPKKTVALKIGSGPSVMPGLGPRPKKPLIIYEFEGSADCRRVREACTMLDLSVEFKPCPGQLYGFNDELAIVTKGTKREVPYMVDNNPSMYKPQLAGRKEIVEYLFAEYGDESGTVPKSMQSAAKGGGKGSKPNPKARPDTTKMKPLTLFGWEGAKFVTPVREVLCELALPHVFINCAQGSANRKKLESRVRGAGFQVPYIIDPNTGVEMFESAEIVKYLLKVYTVA